MIQMLSWSTFILAIVSLVFCQTFSKDKRYIFIAILNLIFAALVLKEAVYILVLVTLINYFFIQKRKTALAFVISLTPLLLLRISANWSWKDIYLSVALAFFCLQQIGAIVDIGRDSSLVPKNLVLWLAFSLFFPSLVAGPLSRWTALSEKLQQPTEFTEQAGWNSISLFLKAVFKKMVFAAPLMSLIEKYFSTSESIGIFFAIGIAVMLRISLWADISAHTDWARAMSNLLGISLPENFRNPVASLSLADFWRRWHITLSTWLQDFVFIPLAFGPLRKKLKPDVLLGVSILITFSVFGLWHGITLSLLFMGFLKGFGVVLQEFLYKKIPRFSNSIILQVIFMTLFVLLPTLLLKMSLPQFFQTITSFDFNYFKFVGEIKIGIYQICFVLCCFFWMAVEKDLFQRVKPRWSIAFIAFVFWLLLADFSSDMSFIYAVS